MSRRPAPDPLRLEALRLAVQSIGPMPTQGSTKFVLDRAESFAAFLSPERSGSVSASDPGSGAEASPSQ